MAQDFFELAIEETPRYEGAPSVAPYRVSSVKLHMPIRSAGIRPNPAPMDRSDELRGLLGAPPLLRDSFAPDGTINERAYFKDIVWLLALAGFDYTVTQGAGTNEVQELAITGSPTGGTFTLTYGAETTAAIAYNATAAQVQAALEALPGLLPGDVVCAGGPLPGTPVTITFQGRLAATNVAAITTTDSLTGGTTPASAITTTTAGAAGAVLDPDGNGIPASAYRWVFTKRDAITARTAQVRQNMKDEDVLFTGQGFAVSSLSLNAAGEMQASLQGLVVAQAAADTSTVPAYSSVSIPPLRRGDLTLTWLSGGAQVDDFSLAIANSLAPDSTLSLDPPSDFPDIMELGNEQVAVTGSIPKRRINGTDFQALLDASTFAATARWRSKAKIGSTGKLYGLWCEMPSCQLRGGGSSDLRNSRRMEASYDWVAAIDEVAGYDVKITVVNALSAIETYA